MQIYTKNIEIPNSRRTIFRIHEYLWYEVNSYQFIISISIEKK